MSLGSSFIPGEGDDSIGGVPNLASGRFDSLGASFGTDILTSTGAFSRQRSDQRGRGAVAAAESRGGDFSPARIGAEDQRQLGGRLEFKEYVGGLQFLFDSLSCNVAERRSPPIFCRANYFSARVFELWSCQPASVSGRYNVVMKEKDFSIQP